MKGRRFEVFFEDASGGKRQHPVYLAAQHFPAAVEIAESMIRLRYEPFDYSIGRIARISDVTDHAPDIMERSLPRLQNMLDRDVWERIAVDRMGFHPGSVDWIYDGVKPSSCIIGFVPKEDIRPPASVQTLGA